MSRSLRVIGIIVAAAVLGALLSLLKGDGGGSRLVLGNLSAPWLLIPFLAGRQYSRPWAAALAGLMATLAALTGFYLQQSPLWELDSRSLSFAGDPAFVWRFVVDAHAVYFLAGLVTAPTFGLLGWLWAARRSRTAAAAMALVFVLEPLAWAGADLFMHPFSFGSYWSIAAGEIVSGVVALYLVFRHLPPAGEA